MVRIQNSNKLDLDGLASRYLNDYLFKRIKGNGSRFHAYSFAQHFIDFKSSSKVQKDKLLKSFLDKLEENDFKLLREIILSRPLKLYHIHRYITTVFPKLLRDSSNEAEALERRVIIESIFDYERFFRSKDISWDSANAMEIHVCPYCNRNSIELIQLKNGAKMTKKALAQFDHFFAQSIAPYLALSFFNLIPSCEKCNAELKGRAIFNLSSNINPFQKCFHSLYEFKPHWDPLTQTVDQIEIVSRKTNGTLTDNIRVFRLVERYNTPKFRSDLAKKIRQFDITSPKYNQSAAYQLGINLSRDEVVSSLCDLMNAPSVPIDINKYIYGKLHLDVLVKFGYLV